MKPRDVRDRVLEDHVGLREMLVSLESLARRVLAGPGKGHGVPLRENCERLLLHLGDHMYWEDLHLEPLLAEGDPVRAERLRKEHSEQRDLLEHALGRMRDSERPLELVAENVIDLIALLREDMRDEEEHLIDALR